MIWHYNFWKELIQVGGYIFSPWWWFKNSFNIIFFKYSSILRLWKIYLAHTLRTKTILYKVDLRLFIKHKRQTSLPRLYFEMSSQLPVLNGCHQLTWLGCRPEMRTKIEEVRRVTPSFAIEMGSVHQSVFSLSLLEPLIIINFNIMWERRLNIMWDLRASAPLSQHLSVIRSKISLFVIDVMAPPSGQSVYYSSEHKLDAVCLVSVEHMNEECVYVFILHNYAAFQMTNHNKKQHLSVSVLWRGGSTVCRLIIDGLSPLWVCYY